MDTDYKALTPIDFGKKYRYLVFTPSYLKVQSTVTPIQMNYCNNPFCKWIGLPQEKFESIKGNPSRYKMVGVRSNASRGIVCNDDVIKTTQGISMNCTTETVSNWSVAEEIKRLININSVVDKEKQYKFHKDGCSDGDKNAFDNRKYFYISLTMLEGKVRVAYATTLKTQNFKHILLQVAILIRDMCLEPISLMILILPKNRLVLQIRNLSIVI
ncbi:hypothetical protein [Clostridium lacusfryxellense]|uniref:hypothetical protein n=1 Tax=Clostridium lacusfryxellense TaxID=205328 RepID=UPI001C0B598D|nr:hypothetical protein [Clostridium lacusfryxellense]MBU3113201.1 hypothetical protein [Clostridium lacusfryxellense]